MQEALVKKKKKKKAETQDASAQSKRMLSIHLDTEFGAFRSAFSLFFFFFWKDCVAIMNFQWVPCIVHETHKPLYSANFSLKISPTALFTYLKIILLQYFQFLFFNGIQADP